MLITPNKHFAVRTLGQDFGDPVANVRESHRVTAFIPDIHEIRTIAVDGHHDRFHVLVGLDRLRCGFRQIHFYALRQHRRCHHKDDQQHSMTSM